MGDVINLRRARKARARDAARATGDANAAAHGLSAAERRHIADTLDRQGRLLDGHRRDRGGPGGDGDGDGA